ncbi:MAG: (d)CMP kinase [Thermodesulfobacteriota bacterium]
MPLTNNVITIDGPAGSGKGTVAKIVAGSIGYSYLDTGAMYRTVAHAIKTNNVDINNGNKLKTFLSSIFIEIKKDNENSPRYFLNNKDVTDNIRTPEITMISSDIAAIKTVRKYLVKLQREIGASGNLVAEGRDMGTYVFPDAEYKFFLEATVEERANRRYKEIIEKKIDIKISYEDVLEDIKNRDKQDRERKESPLHPALNAVIIDTTNLTPNEVVGKILKTLEASSI